MVSRFKVFLVTMFYTHDVVCPFFFGGKRYWVGTWGLA